MKQILFCFFILFIAPSASACVFCNKLVREGVYNSSFYPNILGILSAFIVTILLICAFWVIASKRHKALQLANPGITVFSPVPLTTVALVLGMGTGGLLDGIFFHQIVQWHGVLSNQIEASEYVGKSINQFWDGIYQLFCSLTVLTGLILLWRLVRRNDISTSGRLMSGGFLAGWGMFNLLGGVMNQFHFEQHNLIEFSANHALGNYIYLVFSLFLLVPGILLIQTQKIPLRRQESIFFPTFERASKLKLTQLRKAAMEKHLELKDPEFIEQLGNCSLDPTLFTHEAHLRLAWLQIKKFGIERAIRQIRRQLRNYALSLGVKDKYNETLTVAAIRTVYHFMLKSKASTFRDFISEHPRLKSNFKDLLGFHYKTDIFKSKKAKKKYLEPEILNFD